MLTLSLCSEVKNATKCVRDFFRDCTTPAMKQMARTVYSSVQRKFKKTCSPTGIQKLLQNRECIVSSRPSLVQCYQQTVKDMYAVTQSSDKKSWHAMTCCFGSRSHDCAVRGVKANCPTSAASEDFSRESSQMMDELMETFCPANLVWGTKECANVIAAVPDVVMPNREVSILPIMMDILKEFSLPEEPSS